MNDLKRLVFFLGILVVFSVNEVEATSYSTEKNTVSEVSIQFTNDYNPPPPTPNRPDSRIPRLGSVTDCLLVGVGLGCLVLFIVIKRKKKELNEA